MARSLSIVFMGTPEFAVPSLEKLLSGRHTVRAVVTVSDKPAGRGRKLQQSPVKKLAQQHGLPVLQPEKLKDPGFLETLESFGADLFVVVAFRILPQEVLQIPPMGSVNLHASLLPRYRGAAPIQWAVINGDTKTGVTTFLIKPKVDTGDILLQRETPIGPEETAGELHDRLMEIGAWLVLETVDGLADGTLRPVPQPEGGYTRAPKIFREDGRIDFTKPAREVYNLVRGLNPVPGAWTIFEGKTLKIHRCRPPVPASETPSLEVNPERVLLHCMDGTLEVTELQPEGKRKMTTAEFLRGRFH